MDFETVNPDLSPYQTFIHLSRYARWIESQKRRETYVETAARYVTFLWQHIQNMGIEPDLNILNDVFLGIVHQEAMPSMRCFMTAGKALELDNIAGYNCAFIDIDDAKAFDEILYILMCGTGIGFSVEQRNLDQLPVVPSDFRESPSTIVVSDSKLGWASAFRELISMLYAGRVPKWDVSRVRPAGARLKTMGGRASGPEPLEDLFRFTIATFMGAKGRRLNSLECHDIACKVGDIVVVGGVRRSAMISLSDLADARMRDAKTGEWWDLHPHRQLANNSWVANERPPVAQFMQEWLALYQSKSGERGIFSRQASIEISKKYGRAVFWPNGEPIMFGTNPCSEIILRAMQGCNLSETIARDGDTVEDLERKVRLATFMGTVQATLTKFRYLRKAWQRNCEEERLLGVSLTGIMDCPLLNGSGKVCELRDLLQHLRETARAANGEFAEMLGITPAAAITCVKPSGTVSQLVNSSSGIHARYAKRYIRRVWQDRKDPLTEFMISRGFPHEPDASKPRNTSVFLFPVRTPEGAITRNDRSAVAELEHWKLFQQCWCEHKPSVTINVREHEWPGVGGWVWDNFDTMSGVSFMPNDDHSYRQAPYEEIDEARLSELEGQMPANVEWSRLQDYEKEDGTKPGKEYACVSGVCEI
jgi:ribonucleoside-triphosphate reductase